VETGSYWTKLARNRISRRRLLAGAAVAGAGLAAAPLVGCGGGGGEEAASTAPAATATPELVIGRLIPATSRGGFFRQFSWEPFTIDTLDPHETQFGPISHMLGAVHSKVLTYHDFYESTIEPDLAETMPEQPDDLTYIIKIWPNVTFHDTPQIRNNLRDIAPGVPGRQLTVEDIKYSIERQLNEASPKSELFYRKSQWQTVDTIEVVDPLTLRITTKSPTAPFIHYLADSYAHIIARELVDPETDEMNAVERMVGTGPFILEEFTPLQISRTVRNPNWFGKDLKADEGLPDRPILDGYIANFIPADFTAREVAFRSKQIDTFGVDDPDIVERTANDLGLPWDQTLGSGLVNTRILIDDSPNATTPFKDLRLRRALHLAVDRNRMVQQMLFGGGYPCGPVAQAIKKWAFSQAELATKPGYRFGAAEREEDLQEARQLWEAAGGAAIGTVQMVYAGIPEYIKDYFPQLQASLREALGLQIEGELDPTGYTRLAQGVLEKSVILTFGFDNGWNELDDYVYPFFHSQGPKNSFNLADPKLDAMLEAQRGEMDFERRHELGMEIQDYLLTEVVAMPIYVSNVNSNTDWSYHKNWRRTPWFDDGYWRANQWFDTSDPTWQGRPA
jgi:peptide/nickel transport system substrate-binding protein